MDWNSILDVVIGELRPEQVSPEFILQVVYIDRQGVDHTVSGAELALFMANPARFQTREARVIFDVRKIRHVMYVRVMEFFLDLNRQIVTQKK